MFKNKIDKIIIYPFGGITKYNALLNSNIYIEALIAIGGFIFQFIFYFIILFLYKNGYVITRVFNIFHFINLNLFYFNILPIIPLDGGKILNLMLDLIFPYKYSHIITIVISLITIMLFIIIKFKIIYILLFLLLLKSIIIEIMNHKHKINKFLLERSIYNLRFKDGKEINDINKIKRNKTHKIYFNNKTYNEDEYLRVLCQIFLKMSVINF